jgi:penicillin-binding protein 1A
MGIAKQNLEPFPTLTLGVFGQNTETMASVIGTVAANGVHHTPYVVQKIVGPDGKVLLDVNSPGEAAFGPDVAACEQNMLRRVVTGGTGTKADVPGHEVFGKTGTTDSQGDAWFIGATPQLATAVWYGNWQRVEGPVGFGGDAAAPVFREFMTGALDGMPDLPLPPPGPVCARSGSGVNPTGGHGAAVLPAPVVPDLPAAPATPTTPAATTPATTAPAATTPTTPATAPAAGGTGT